MAKDQGETQQGRDQQLPDLVRVDLVPMEDQPVSMDLVNDYPHELQLPEFAQTTLPRVGAHVFGETYEDRIERAAQITMGESVKLDDVIGETISINEVVFELRNGVDKETSEEKTWITTYLGDNAGHIYRTSSGPVREQLKRLASFAGSPPPWRTAVQVKVRQVGVTLENGKMGRTFRLVPVKLGGK